MDGDRVSHGGGDGSEPVWDLPWKRYRGKSRDEIRGIARWYRAMSLALWVAAGILFIVAALSLVPRFGPEQNVEIVLVVFVLAVAALMTTSVWIWMDRAGHGEPRLDPEWMRWQSSSSWWKHILVGNAARVVTAVLMTILAIFGLVRSIPALLAAASVLILVLLLLLVRDHRKRRSA